MHHCFRLVRVCDHALIPARPTGSDWDFLKLILELGLAVSVVQKPPQPPCWPSVLGNFVPALPPPYLFRSRPSDVAAPSPAHSLTIGWALSPSNPFFATVNPCHTILVIARGFPCTCIGAGPARRLYDTGQRRQHGRGSALVRTGGWLCYAFSEIALGCHFDPGCVLVRHPPRPHHRPVATSRTLCRPVRQGARTVLANSDIRNPLWL